MNADGIIQPIKRGGGSEEGARGEQHLLHVRQVLHAHQHIVGVVLGVLQVEERVLAYLRLVQLQ